jgi:cell division protein FtsN
MRTRGNGGWGVVQLLALMFGFLLASVIIFAFGIWVGRDLASHREQEDRPIVVRPAERPDQAIELPTVAAAAGPTLRTADRRPTRPRFEPASATPVGTPTPTRAARATSTAPRRPTLAANPTAKPRVEVTAATWTVQAAATNEQVQALVVKRSLQNKGYDAFVAQSEIGGSTWYRVQVGRFNDKKQAEVMAEKLRREGMSAAFADRLR